MADDKSVLYSRVESDEINQLVQSQIAPHLFLTCNYTPSPYLLLSEDAKFVVGILNLYKFVIDSSIIDKIPNIMDATMGSAFNKKEFSDKIDIVKALRTVYCHNESEISGNDDEIKKVNNWMQKTPQTIADYKRLNQQLQKLSADIVTTVHKFIEEASKTKQQTVLIEKWESIIKTFYQRPNTRNILVGQLKKIYSAKKGILSMDRTANLDMAICVRKYYVGDLESKLEEKKNNYRILCGTRRISLKAEDKVKLRKIIETVEEDLEKRKSQIVRRLGNGKTIDEIDRNDYLYLELYLKELPQRIIDLIDKTADTNIYGTLLPQNIVQYILKQDFDLIIR